MVLRRRPFSGSRHAPLFLADAEPIRLLVKRGELYPEVALDYHRGLLYPMLERVGSGPSSLDALLAPLS